MQHHKPNHDEASLSCSTNGANNYLTDLVMYVVRTQISIYLLNNFHYLLLHLINQLSNSSIPLPIPFTSYYLSISPASFHIVFTADWIAYNDYNFNQWILEQNFFFKQVQFEQNYLENQILFKKNVYIYVCFHWTPFSSMTLEDLLTG